jgi:hypothetical protein
VIDTLTTLTLVHLGDLVVSDPGYKGYCTTDYSTVRLKGIAPGFFDSTPTLNEGHAYKQDIEYLSVSSPISNLEISFCHLRLSISGFISLPRASFGVPRCGDGLAGQG